MSGRNEPPMSKEELAAGFAKGHALIQVEWASEEIAAVNDLIPAGKARSSKIGLGMRVFPCCYRKVKGVPPVGRRRLCARELPRYPCAEVSRRHPVCQFPECRP